MSANFSPEAVPFDSGRWLWKAREHRIETHLGRQALFLKTGTGWVEGVSFLDGMVEFDLAFSGERGFPGGTWRVRETSWEEFYLRPHQSGNPDATQYTPVFNGLEGWQLYHGPRYSVPITHRADEWTHVRILFAGPQAEIYVGDMENPVLTVGETLGDGEPGSVGVKTGEFAPAWFSNFRFQPMDSPPIRGKARPPEPPPPGLIPSWSVSDAFPEGSLDGRATLAPEDLAARRWTTLPIERSGLANLARIQGVKLRDNTVFARATLISDREELKQLDFGFSDRVRVYLNGRLLYRGNDTARSRDYRFLGSIGWWDTLYLPLRQGPNEILLAVTEEVGGWGVQCKLPDPTGIVFQE